MKEQHWLPQGEVGGAPLTGQIQSVSSLDPAHELYFTHTCPTSFDPPFSIAKRKLVLIIPLLDIRIISSLIMSNSDFMVIGTNPS